MQKIFDENFYKVEIKWTNPIRYENIFNLPEEKMELAWYYKILAKYATGEYKLLYIGKTERTVSQRLNDRDHINKVNRFKKEYPNHKFFVSLGNVYKPDYLNPTKVDQIETLLIFAHGYLPYITNEKKVWAHRIKNDYEITNRGFRKDVMFRSIALGVFVK